METTNRTEELGTDDCYHDLHLLDVRGDVVGEIVVTILNAIAGINGNEGSFDFSLAELSVALGQVLLIAAEFNNKEKGNG